MKKYRVKFEIWRTSFSDRDYCDSIEEVVVSASSIQSAKNKAWKPYKGQWSQSIWPEYLEVTEMRQNELK